MKESKRSPAELHTAQPLVVHLSPHRWLPCNHYELAVMHHDVRIVCDYGAPVLDISKLRIDFGVHTGVKTLQDHLQKKISEAVSGVLASMTFNLKIIEQDNCHVRFVLEPVLEGILELQLPRYFETSPATFERAVSGYLQPLAATPLEVRSAAAA